MNPLKEVAPWARIVTLIICGTAVIYGIGRWDQRISSQDAQLESQTKAILATARTSRQWRDSLRAAEGRYHERDADLAAAERRHQLELDRLDSLAQGAVATLARTPLDSLLPALRMRAIQLPDSGGAAGRVVYATDSAGVRVLAGRMLRLGQLEQAREVRDSLAAARVARIAVLTGARDAARLRGDSAEARLLIVEPLLERYLERGSCRILWLVPCPSRTTSFVIGAGVGALAILLVQ